MKDFATLFLVGLFLTTPALAQNDEELVREGVLEFYARLNAGDASYAAFWHPEATAYARAGGLLASTRDVSTAQAAFDAGLEYSVTVRNVEVKIFNGDGAVVTYYTGGIVRNPNGGNVEGGSYRASMIWTKDDGEWKIVHLHTSPLD